VLIVGFQAEHTTGRRIVERRPEIKLFGEMVPLRAQVEILNGYSAHADRTELLRWLDGVKAHTPELRDVYLVHGEPDAQDAFASKLEELGYRASCPAPGHKVQV
jgi:metallo-beta-lactamase family protein